MRILHTSDWHLGRQFHHHSLLEDQAYILQQIADIAEQQQVDVLLIAGDIYDRSVPPASAIELLDDFIQRVNGELNIPIIMSSGNHDSGQRLAFGSRQLAKAGIYISGILKAEPQATVLSDEHGDVAFYAVPYADPATVRDVMGVEVSSYDQATQIIMQQIRNDNPKQRRCVVLSHCFLDGGEGSESERPLSVGGSDQVSAEHFKDFNYVALGHLHGPQFRLKPHIRYSGSPLKYSFSEQNHKKSVAVVDMDESGACEISVIPLLAMRNMRIIEGYFDSILSAAANDEHTEDYVMVRLLDKQAFLDVMGKLREVYPNILHLERPGLMQGGVRQKSSREHLNRGEMPLFRDFYQQMTGEEVDATTAELVSGLLDKIHREEA